MTNYYFTDGKDRFGPFTLEQLKEKNLGGETLVWKDGLVDWVRASELSELQSLFGDSAVFPPPVAMPYTNPVSEIPPKNWLIESILVTIFCCLPIGIVGIIHATKVDTLWATNHREAALKASQEAGKWVKIGAIIGFVFIVLYIMLMFFGVVASLGSGLEV